MGIVTTLGHELDAENLRGVITKIGIGNGTASPNPDLRSLSGDATYITNLVDADKVRVGNVVRFSKEIGAANGNFPWNECAIFTVDDTMYSFGRLDGSLDKQRGDTAEIEIEVTMN